MNAGTFTEYGRRSVVYLELRISPAQSIGRGFTVDHAPVPADAVEVSITGSVHYAKADGSRDLRYTEGYAYGQVLDELRKVRNPRARRIAELWDRWHLNGMRANCAHMPALNGHYSAGYPCDAGTGYTSGSAWLYEPIPAEIIAELRALFGQGE